MRSTCTTKPKAVKEMGESPLTYILLHTFLSIQCATSFSHACHSNTPHSPFKWDFNFISFWLVLQRNIRSRWTSAPSSVSQRPYGLLLCLGLYSSRISDVVGLVYLHLNLNLKSLYDLLFSFFFYFSFFSSFFLEHESLGIFSSDTILKI